MFTHRTFYVRNQKKLACTGTKSSWFFVAQREFFVDASVMSSAGLSYYQEATIETNTRGRGTNKEGRRPNLHSRKLFSGLRRKKNVWLRFRHPSKWSHIHKLLQKLVKVKFAKAHGQIIVKWFFWCRPRELWFSLDRCECGLLRENTPRFLDLRTEAGPERVPCRRESAINNWMKCEVVGLCTLSHLFS